jgi:hypothetical protein
VLTCFQFVNVFSSSIFLHWCWSYRLRMDESKSETNVKRCGECVVIRYIFRVIYGKIVFVVMYLIIKSIWVNGSGCLISYMNVVALLNYYRMSWLWPLCHSEFLCIHQSKPSTYVVNLLTHMGPPCSVYLSPSWIPWNATECLRIQSSALECSRVPLSL